MKLVVIFFLQLATRYAFGLEYCYSYSCVSETACPSLSDAASQENVAYCEKPSDGCFWSRVVTSDSTIITAGCVGQSPANTNCTAVYSSIDDLETTSICCNSDRCNNGTLTMDPNKKYCYAYSCVSAPCTPIAESIQQGKISVCEQSDDKGCVTSSWISTDNTGILAGCVGITPGLDACMEMSSSAAGIDVSMSCCTSNLCNAGEPTVEPTMDPNKKYCYVYSCISAPCTPIAEAIEQGKVSTCEQSGNKGCITSSVISEHNTAIVYGCVGVTDTCTEKSSNQGGFDISTSCCTSNLCNAGEPTVVPTVDPNKKYCYVYNCLTSPCKTIGEAIEQGKVSTCEQSGEKGCMTSIMISTANTAIVTGCVESQSTCMELSSNQGGYDISTSCCTSNLCNTGEPTVEPTVEPTMDPNKKYCYAYNCLLGPCSPVAEAIEQGKVSTCEQSGEKGCMTSIMISTANTAIVTGCVDAEGTCMVLTSTEGGYDISTSCCTSNLCNAGEPTVEPTMDPNKQYCYVYSCVMAPCTPIADAIEQGKVSTCEQSGEKGCMTSSVMSTVSTAVVTGCVGVTPKMDSCTEVTSNVGGMSISTSCCTSNLCNAGDSVGTEQPTDTTPVPSLSSTKSNISSTEPSVSSAEPSVSSSEPSISSTEPSAYCHVYACASTSASCTSLSDAVKQGKTTKCQKSDKGCFVMKIDNSMLAGCVGETSGITECKAAPPINGTEIICCKTNGCNSNLTSASRPLFSHGAAILVLLIFSITATLWKY